jgi:hypothetical protein
MFETFLVASKPIECFTLLLDSIRITVATVGITVQLAGALMRRSLEYLAAPHGNIV